MEEEEEFFSGLAQDRCKLGKCVVNGCKDTKLLDCIRCGRHDLCFEHMGGLGFTRIYCKDCIKIVSAQQYLANNASGVKQPSEYTTN